MATVVPRSKKRKTSNDASVAASSAGPSNSQSASASRSTKGFQTVNEVIGGKLQEVFVLDSDDDAPPSRPLAADLPPRARPSRTRVVNGLGSSSNATLNGNGNGHFTRSSRNGTGTANGTGVAAEAGPSSSKAKGKRKANGSLSASESVGLDSVSDAGAQGSGSAPSTKRRKKDVNDVNTITQSATIAARNQAALAAQQSRALQIQNAQAQALLQQHQQQHHQHQQQQQQQYNQLYRPNVPSGSGYLAQQQQQQQAAWAAGARYANGSASYSEGVGSDRLSQQSYLGPPSPPPGLPVDDKEGHFIVREGDNVSSRYKILSQLGQGTFGKVVECYDKVKKQYVAIKIIRAIQKYRDASQIEIRVLKTLREEDPRNDNKCIHLLDTFSFRNHVCIVSELLGKSVFDFLKENDFAAFPPRHIWDFAQQLLKSVAFLHRLNLVHTDLKPENILLVDSGYTIVGTSRRPNAKKKRVLNNSEIRLIDFGSATFNNEYHSAVVSTRHYRAPEIILNMGWSFPCDAWSIGCILVEFYTGDALFQTHDNLEHLAMMEAVLGTMPEDYRRKAETYKPELFRGGGLDYPNPQTPKTSRRYVRGMKKLHEILPSAQSTAAFAKHHRCFLHLIRRLLEFDPAKRMTVQEALAHDYFRLQPSEIP